ncbi:IS1380 family transposase [Arthrobacter sp. CAN_A1]|uniref:IS1380 family transposase n=1 Tax=Arthrobacter sp. CAN_A1 TaxID=2787717 RepID=UPI0018C8F3F5
MTILPSVFPSLPVAFTGQSLISHAGTQLVSSFIDALGFRELCEDRLGQFTPAGARHRPGTLLGQLALMLAAGGEHVSDLDMFRTQAGVFGTVASNATVSRFFDRTAANPDAFAHGAQTLTRLLRTRVWDAAGEHSPGARATPADPVIIDLDATLVASHSDKERVAGDYKGGYGFAPFTASIDYGTKHGTGEILACLLRPGNAGANNADDHIEVFTTAVNQLPDGFFHPDGTLNGKNILVRTDSAGASRKFLWHLHHAGAQFSVSYPVPAGKAHMVDWISDKQYWEPALDAEGNDRTDAWVINATDVITLKDYPPGTNIYLRAEPLHPGAQPTLLDIDGHRITAFLTNSPRWRGPFLDARHRGRGRCENRIKTLKNTGLGKLPFASFTANQAWATISALASNLISWLQLSTIPATHRARFWDVKRFRYRLFATAGKLTRHGRKTTLLLPELAPEKNLIITINDAITSLAERQPEAALR